MKTAEIITAIDEELARLRRARDIVVGLDSSKKRGRPAGVSAQQKAGTKRRTLSAEARAKIAAAQKKRWAKVKKD